MPLKKKKNKRTLLKRKTATVKREKKRQVLKKKQVKKDKKAILKKVKEKTLGVVTHYFPKVRAAVVKLKGDISIGQAIKIKGHTTEFSQDVVSLQIDRVPINSAKKGQEIGLLVNSRVRNGDLVYKQ